MKYVSLREMSSIIQDKWSSDVYLLFSYRKLDEMILNVITCLISFNTSFISYLNVEKCITSYRFVLYYKKTSRSIHYAPHMRNVSFEIIYIYMLLYNKKIGDKLRTVVEPTTLYI